jgi:hypothetical protein
MATRVMLHAGSASLHWHGSRHRQPSVIADVRKNNMSIYQPTAYALIVMLGCGALFYYIGDHEYHNKGWHLAGASFLLSLGALFLLPLSFLGVIGANLALYLGVFLYNMFSGRPPGSRSGF